MSGIIVTMIVVLMRMILHDRHRAWDVMTRCTSRLLLCFRSLSWVHCGLGLVSRYRGLLRRLGIVMSGLRCLVVFVWVLVLVSFSSPRNEPVVPYFYICCRFILAFAYQFY